MADKYSWLTSVLENDEYSIYGMSGTLEQYEQYSAKRECSELLTNSELIDFYMDWSNLPPDYADIVQKINIENNANIEFVTPNVSLNYFEHPDFYKGGAKAATNGELSQAVDEKCQKIYRSIKRLEPLITNDILMSTKKFGGTLEGLEYSVKTASSIEDKIARVQKNNPDIESSQVLKNLNDIIRYTVICNHNDIIKNTKTIINELETNCGYHLSGLKNYYKNNYPNTGYKGMHLNFITDYGQTIELQVHSKLSFDIKQEGHKMYEVMRSVSTPPAEKEKIKPQLVELHQSVPNPEGYQELNDFALTKKEIEKIKDALPKVVIKTDDVKLNNKMGEMTSNMFSVSRNGEIILSGFENHHSDNSVVKALQMFKNDQKGALHVMSYTKNGEITSYENAIGDIRDIGKNATVTILKNYENLSKSWNEFYDKNIKPPKDYFSNMTVDKIINKQDEIKCPHPHSNTIETNFR